MNNSKESRIIPLIGDISPDCKPEWLIDIDKCKIINGNYLEGPNLRDSWNNLFNNIDTDKFPKIINKNYINNNNNLFPDSGWYKFNHGRFILFIRQDKKGFPNHVGHHHQDFGHFVLFIDNHEFIIDIGRKNYINKNGVFPNFHNTVQVDGLGVIPKYPHRYPHKYSQFSNTLDYDQKNGKINIKISTDGFTRLNKKNCWERTLVLKENEFTINDMIIGFNKKSKISANFYFSDKILLNKTRNNKINISSDSISGLFESDNIGTNIDLIKANRYKIYGKQNDCTLLRYNYDLKNHSSIKYKIKLS